MKVDPSQIRLHLLVNVDPEWKCAQLLRAALLNCVAVVLRDQDFSESVGMVASELIENAVKYGDWSRGGHLIVEVSGDLASILVKIGSPAAPYSPHLLRLKEELSWMRSFPSPREAYLSRVSQLATGALPQGESRMGLVRMVYEAGCELEACVEGEIVFLEARLTLKDRA